MFKKFPHIEQFKNCIKDVRTTAHYNTVAVPKIKFKGTVKLHGTNSAVVYDVQKDEFFYQSRERLLTVQSDNYGFAMWASGNKILQEFIHYLRETMGAKQHVHVFGEWAGKGVQKGVGISEFQKSFYIFAISIDDNWLELPNCYPAVLDNFNSNGIFFITQFPTFETEIDFVNPELSQNELVELTMNVEQECPVTKARGIPGTVGEGIVWSATWMGKHFIFKTKGEKHSNSKVKTLKELAPVDVEKMNSIKEFAQKFLNTNRLEQGLQKLSEQGLDASDSKNTGAYIKWCVDDVFREERDIIVESQFDAKVLGRELSNIARQYFLTRV